MSPKKRGPNLKKKKKKKNSQWIWTWVPFSKPPCYHWAITTRLNFYSFLKTLIRLFFIGTAGKYTNCNSSACISIFKVAIIVVQVTEADTTVLSNVNAGVTRYHLWKLKCWNAQSVLETHRVKRKVINTNPFIQWGSE